LPSVFLAISPRTSNILPLKPGGSHEWHEDKPKVFIIKTVDETASFVLGCIIIFLVKGTTHNKRRSRMANITQFRRKFKGDYFISQKLNLLHRIH